VAASVVRASSAAAEHSGVIVGVVVVAPWSGVRAMAVLAFAALSTEGTGASVALVLAFSPGAVVVWGGGVGLCPVVLHLSLRLCVGCFCVLWDILALLGVSPSMTVAVVSTSSMVASRSKERMNLQVSVEEIPVGIRGLVELVDGSHLEVIDQ
jgi:hypothetical protein